MRLIFSDLDGTLLDDDYSFQAAAAGLDAVRSAAIPLILTTSKTRAEVEYWRNRLDNRDPFIVENGAAVYMPRGNGYDVIELGARYEALVRALVEAADSAGCRIRGFHQMPVEEIAALSGLSLEQAALARRREYDEPFEILDGNEHELLAAVEARGFRWTRGGRFFHIIGASDKARAVLALRARYRADVVTIGLGDSLNDATFLNVMDIAILIRSPFLDRLQAAVPQGRVTRLPGPAGWNEAVLEVLAETAA
ncbi:MAG: HAD-IIB family hydrolase [Bryobacteraceae bacterium]